MGNNIIQDRSIDLTGVGGIKFSEAEHTYHNANGVRYTGITTLLGNYHEHFDDDIMATNKAIKDMVILDYGTRLYNQKMLTDAGKLELRSLLNSTPNYLKNSFWNEAIKEVTEKELGEDKYLLLEKQVAGYDNLYSKIKKLKVSKPSLYNKILKRHNDINVITQLGTEEYRRLKGVYGGFEELYNAMDEIEMKHPELYDKILEHKQWLLNKWEEINLRATTEGTIEHDKREQEIYTNGGYEHEGVWYDYVEGKNITNVTVDDRIVIPECMVWNHDMELGGLADIFLFNKGVINVLDYKTNRSIDIKPDLPEPFWKYMTGPCSSLLDLNFYHYSLQLKIYQRMAIMLRPEFSAGINVIIHTTSDTHYRYEDALYDCHEVNDIVTDIFEELKNK